MKRQPPPDDRENLSKLVTFRLTEAEWAALRALADEFDIGHASLCRRIVQQYLRENTPKRRRK